MNKKIVAAVAAIVVILGAIFLYTNSNKPQALKQDEMFNFGKFMDAHIEEINTKTKREHQPRIAEELIGKEITICGVARLKYSEIQGAIGLANNKYKGWLFDGAYRILDTPDNVTKLNNIKTGQLVTLKGTITRVLAATNLRRPIEGIKKVVTMELTNAEIIEVTNPSK